MKLQDEFVNGVDKMEKMAFSVVKGSSKKWASIAVRKGIITLKQKIQIGDLVHLRDLIGHGSAGKIIITKSNISAVNFYIRTINRTANRFKKRGNNEMPVGTFRSYVQDYVKEFDFDDLKGRNYHFKFEIVYRYQECAYDDGTSFSGEGYTIYVIEAPYRDWCLEYNRKYEFHFYGIPRGSESICWNRLITEFEDANMIMFQWAKRYKKILERLLDEHSVNIENYDRNQRTKYNMPTGTFRTPEMKFSYEVFNEIKNTIGKMKAEQGGILGIGNDSDVVDYFVHDKNAHVGNAEYNPNISFLDKTINNYWAVNNIEFCGFVHSHPKESSMLSDADVEYAINIMKEFDLEYLFMPLVKSSSDGKFRIIGFYVHVNGAIEHCKIFVEEENIFQTEKLVEPVFENASKLSEKDIMDYFENSKASPIINSVENAFTRIESCFPLEYLRNCAVIGIGCGGSREFYIDMSRMGVMNFALMDGDVVSVTNLSSQNVYLDEIGKSKTEITSEKIKLINEKNNVLSIPKMLDDSLDDSWFEDNILKQFEGKHILLCAFTDSFYAQARISNIAVKYNLPLISGQHHKFGLTSEIAYWYPGVSIATPKSILVNRYNSYKKGFQNNVTSDGSPIFNTTRLNALCEKVSIGMLLFGNNKYNDYSSFLIDSPESNLILIRQNSLIGTKSDYSSLFDNKRNCLFDDPIWIKVEKEEKYLVDDTRVIFE